MYSRRAGAAGAVPVGDADRDGREGEGGPAVGEGALTDGARGRSDVFSTTTGAGREYLVFLRSVAIGFRCVMSPSSAGRRSKIAP